MRLGRPGGSGDPGAVPGVGRELAVLRLLPPANSNREIGDLLGISDGTVKIHLTHLLPSSA